MDYSSGYQCQPARILLRMMMLLGYNYIPDQSYRWGITSSAGRYTQRGAGFSNALGHKYTYTHSYILANSTINTTSYWYQLTYNYLCGTMITNSYMFTRYYCYVK